MHGLTLYLHYFLRYYAIGIILLLQKTCFLDCVRISALFFLVVFLYFIFYLFFASFGVYILFTGLKGVFVLFKYFQLDFVYSVLILYIYIYIYKIKYLWKRIVILYNNYSSSKISFCIPKTFFCVIIWMFSDLDCFISCHFHLTV